MQTEHSPFGRRKYGEYIRDFTALGNPFLLFSMAALTWQGLGRDFGGFAYLALFFALNEALCSGIKYVWHKPRPDGQAFSGGMEKIDAGSFPSIHSARLALMGGSLAYQCYLAGLYPGLFIWALWIPMIGYTRIFLSRHYPTDVAAGYTIGGGLAWVLAYWIL